MNNVLPVCNWLDWQTTRCHRKFRNLSPLERRTCRLQTGSTLFRFQQRAEDHIADAFRAGESRRRGTEAVNADAYRHYRNQSSTRNPATRPNSLVLLLTKVNPCATQIAAIFKSFGPMIPPCVSRSCRMAAY